MAVKTFDTSGADITDSGEAGELVCTVPFRCQPVIFWPPGSKREERYRSSYFETFKVDEKPVWHHGDYVKVNPETGGIWMLGRSDGVLNPGGVRFGSSEIYNVLLKEFGEVVEDALCVWRRREGDADELVVLLMKMAEGKSFDEALVKRIKEVVRKELSARHVPAVIDECKEIPHTVNGKKVEGAIKQILCGMKVKTTASVSNRECLEFYKKWAEEN